MVSLRPFTTTCLKTLIYGGSHECMNWKYLEELHSADGLKVTQFFCRDSFKITITEFEMASW